MTTERPPASAKPVHYTDGITDGGGVVAPPCGVVPTVPGILICSNWSYVTCRFCMHARMLHSRFDPLDPLKSN